jgi:hypothetical protein
MFYDYNLNLLPDYDSIVWDNGCFRDTAMLSQLIYFLKHKFPKDKKICIIHHISKVYDSINAINLSDIDLVIVNNSDHPLKFGDAANVIKKPFIHLGFDFNKENHHPWHLLWSHWLAKQDFEIDFTSPRSRRMSCLFMKPRINRVFNTVELSNRAYFNDIFTTWADRFNHPSEVMHDDGMSASDIETHWDKWLELEKTIPLVREIATEFDSCQNITNGFTDTYLNIVAEARPADFGWLTEKIYKPFRAGQLFVAQSAPGTIRYLRSIGFDTYDDYIDHDRYDNVKDWKSRTSLMHTVLDEIEPKLEEIFNNTVERRRRNCEHLKSQSLVDFVLSQ